MLSSKLPTSAAKRRIQILRQDIEEYRDAQWRREDANRVEIAAEADKSIEQVGFIARLTDSRRPGPRLHMAVCRRGMRSFLGVFGIISTKQDELPIPTISIHGRPESSAIVLRTNVWKLPLRRKMFADGSIVSRCVGKRIRGSGLSSSWVQLFSPMLRLSTMDSSPTIS
jgi:hypothetical protein